MWGPGSDDTGTANEIATVSEGSARPAALTQGKVEGGTICSTTAD